MGKVLLSNLVDELATRDSVSHDVANSFMHAFIDVIEKGLQADNIVKVKGLGTFKLQEVNSRDSVDVNTGERITIKGYRKVSFTPDSAMKEFVNRPFAHFEPTELNEGFPTDMETESLDSSIVENDEADTVEEVELQTVDEPSAIAADECEEKIAEPTEESKFTEELIDSSATEYAEKSMFTDESIDERVDVPTDETLAESEHADVNVDVLSAQANEDEPEAEDKHTQVNEEESPVIQSKSREEKKSRKGCGCLGTLLLFVVLALAAAGVVYYLWTSPVDLPKDVNYTGDVKDNNDIVVRPDLGGELGLSHEETTDQDISYSMEDSMTLSSDNSDTIGVEISQITEPANELQSQLGANEIVHEAHKANLPTDEPKTCVVAITESLKARNVKDITLVDTADYKIVGTYVSHKLKSGETIIQLAYKYYGDKRLWPYIVLHNQMKQYNSLAIGQIIDIPVLKERVEE
jgi:nucleoid DNA-binding protein/nucleoid-associated protein YgaU